MIWGDMATPESGAGGGEGETERNVVSCIGLTTTLWYLLTGTAGGCDVTEEDDDDDICGTVSSSSITNGLAKFEL